MEPAGEEKKANQDVQPVVVRREPEKDIFTWMAPSRPFKKRSREFYVTLFAIVGLVGLILFIAEGAMPVILLIALTFLFYVLANVPPEEIQYRITNKGIRIADKRVEWELLGRFCFVKKLGSELLVIETFFLPGKIELVIKEENKEEIRKALSAYLVEEEIKPTGFEKFVAWVASKLPDNAV